jgi:integrase
MPCCLVVFGLCCGILVTNVQQLFKHFMRNTFYIRRCKHGNRNFVVRGLVNGKRVSAFFRTKVEAEIHCERRNIELINHGHSMAAMSNALRAEALACSDRLAAIGASLTKATDFYLQVHDARAKSVSVEFAWNECKSDLKRMVKGEEISVTHLETVAKAANKLVASFGQEWVCDLSSQVMERWLNGLPLAATTRNNVRKNVSVILAYAVKRGWIEESPMLKIKGFNEHRLKAKLPGILTPEEMALLLERAEPEILPFFAIGAFAGLRVAELERLDWSEIKWDKRLINVTALKAKTAQPRWIPMTDNLIAWLTPHRQSNGPIAPQSVRVKSRFVKRAREAAGINSWGNDKANALRHSFCSYHLALHEDGAMTAIRAGHMGTATLYKHYNHRVEKTEAEKYFSIAPAAAAQSILAIA